MAQRRLTDSELATRVRASNVRRAERRRERLATAGYVQTVVWLPVALRRQVDTTAAERNATISETAERLLSAGLNATAPVSTPSPVDAPAPSPGAVETMLDMFGKPATPATPTTTDRDALMREIGAMLAEGHSGNEVARRLNASGRRTFIGAEFSGANLLRDYRAWCKKTGAVDATKEPA